MGLQFALKSWPWTVFAVAALVLVVAEIATLGAEYQGGLEKE